MPRSLAGSVARWERHFGDPRWSGCGGERGIRYNRGVRRWELTLALDPAREQPLFLQLASAIAEDIRRGRLKPGEPLPGTRALERAGRSRTRAERPGAAMQRRLERKR